MSNLRQSVLRAFKSLHRTRIKVFEGDTKALNAARVKINEEFNRNKHVTDEDAIKTLLKLSEDVEKELKTRVIQAQEVKPGVFVAKITKDTLTLENKPFNEKAAIEDVSSQIRPCCQDEMKSK